MKCYNQQIDDVINLFNSNVQSGLAENTIHLAADKLNPKKTFIILSARPDEIHFAYKN